MFSIESLFPVNTVGYPQLGSLKSGTISYPYSQGPIMKKM